MHRIYIFSVAIFLLFICSAKAQNTDLPIIVVKTMDLEKFKGTLSNATEYELVLTQKGIESPLHIKPQNIRKIHVPRYPKPGPGGALLGALIGILPGAVMVVAPLGPSPGSLDLRRLDGLVVMAVGGLAGSIIGHIIRKNAGPKFRINGNIDTYRQQRNAINKFGYTN